MARARGRHATGRVLRLCRQVNLRIKDLHARWARRPHAFQLPCLQLPSQSRAHQLSGLVKCKRLMRWKHSSQRMQSRVKCGCAWRMEDTEWLENGYWKHAETGESCDRLATAIVNASMPWRWPIEVMRLGAV